MTCAEAIQRIEEQLSRLQTVRQHQRYSPEFKKWWRDTKTLLERIFGKGTGPVKDFLAVATPFSGVVNMGDDSPFDRHFRAILANAEAILKSISDELERYGIDSDSPSPPDMMSVIELICRRFHSVTRQLRKRHKDRPTLDVSDEYDVQDLLHALLRIHFDDIRAEEHTPSYAGSSSRMDFLLKDDEIVIEVKKTRTTLREREITDELVIDVARYKTHPNCKTLVCFVYDPEGYIGNFQAVKKDIEKTCNDLPVKVFIFPQT